MAKRLLVLVISLTLVMFLAAGCTSSSTTAAGGGVPATSGFVRESWDLAPIW
jgi:hypothetical protein